MAEVEGVISPELAKLLESRREELNRLYRQRAGLRSKAASEDFLTRFGTLVQAAVGPILKDSRLKESAGNVVKGIFLVALELSERGRLGAEAGGFDKGLAAMLAAFPGPVAQDPERLVRSAVAAMESMAEKSGEALSKWLSFMAGCSGAVAGMDDFLKTGLTAAWLSGMPQYRQAALKAMASLPKQAASLLLGFSKTDPAVDPAKALQSLSSNPWFDPASMKKGATPPKACFTTAGGWRGYGGQFENPPTLKVEDGEVLAVDGKSAYRLYADRWGTFLLYDPDANPEKAKRLPAVDLALQRGGFRFGGKSYTEEDVTSLNEAGFPWSRADLSPSSSVHDEATIFFTHPLSHRVFIIGLAGQEHG